MKNSLIKKKSLTIISDACMSGKWTDKEKIVNYPENLSIISASLPNQLSVDREFVLLLTG